MLIQNVFTVREHQHSYFVLSLGLICDQTARLTKLESQVCATNRIQLQYIFPGHFYVTLQWILYRLTYIRRLNTEDGLQIVHPVAVILL